MYVVAGKRYMIGSPFRRNVMRDKPMRSEYQSHKEWSNTSRRPMVQRVSVRRPVIKLRTVINYLIVVTISSVFWYAYFCVGAMP